MDKTLFHDLELVGFGLVSLFFCFLGEIHRSFLKLTSSFSYRPLRLFFLPCWRLIMVILWQLQVPWDCSALLELRFVIIKHLLLSISSSRHKYTTVLEAVLAHPFAYSHGLMFPIFCYRHPWDKHGTTHTCMLCNLKLVKNRVWLSPVPQT